MADLAIIVTGVSGSGKSTIGRLLAEKLGWVFADADDFHPAGNVAKLADGHTLTDADRSPWLAALGDWLDEEHRSSRSVVLACSALKRSYRDRLKKGRPQVHVLLLHGPNSLIAERLSHRTGHFMKAHMLEGQLSELELPQADEDVKIISIDATPEQIVSDIVTELNLDPSALSFRCGHPRRTRHRAHRPLRRHRIWRIRSGHGDCDVDRRGVYAAPSSA